MALMTNEQKIRALAETVQMLLEHAETPKRITCGQIANARRALKEILK
jgi:hypothetical protein